jgi:D,D-heptose 1,7-bisphosphate phosphatase
MEIFGMDSAVFVDRDGTINKLNGIIKDIDSVEILEGAGQAIKMLNDLKLAVIVITNQPVIARGEISKDKLAEIHSHISNEISKFGGKIDDFFYCPHYPTKVTNTYIKSLTFQCDCRKPGVELIIRAKTKYNINLSKSWIIGDSWRDQQMAINLKMNYYKITDSKTTKNEVSSLLEAATKINSFIADPS